MTMINWTSILARGLGLFCAVTLAASCATDHDSSDLDVVVTHSAGAETAVTADFLKHALTPLEEWWFRSFPSEAERERQFFEEYQAFQERCKLTILINPKPGSHEVRGRKMYNVDYIVRYANSDPRDVSVVYLRGQPGKFLPSHGTFTSYRAPEGALYRDTESLHLTVKSIMNATKQQCMP